MAHTGASTNRTFKLKIDHLPWELDNVRMIFLEKVFCLSAVETVVLWVIFSADLFFLSLAFYGLCCLKPNHTLPIFVINLFISDLMQICIRPVINLCLLNLTIGVFYYVYSMSILANIGFMVCISMERYIMIKYPVWYRLHNTSKNSFVICFFVWLMPCLCMVTDVTLALKGSLEHIFIVSVFLFLLPYPVVVFSFVGSWRALSHSIAVTPNEKKRILWVLALVLFNYTVLFMPSIVQSTIFSLSFEHGQSSHDYLNTLAGILVYLNPLADSLLYVFLRKDANSMLKCLCCKRLHDNQAQRANSSNSFSRRSEVQISVQTVNRVSLVDSFVDN